MSGDLLCFSNAMSPSSLCRNHKWLSLLPVTEQGLVQTTNRSIAAVWASEVTKMFNVIFQHILVNHPCFHHRALSHLLSAIQTSAYWQLSLPYLYVKLLLLRSQPSWNESSVLAGPLSAINLYYKSFLHVRAFSRPLGWQEAEAAKLGLAIYSGFLKW